MDQDQQSRLKELIAKGKEQGFLTYTEVNDHLPEGIVEPEQIEDIIRMINDMGIKVHESAPAESNEILNDTETEPDEDAAEEAAAALASLDSEFGRTTDPVRMYMREMGTVELLTREGEIKIARRIENGLNQAMSSLARYPDTMRLILERYNQVREEEAKLSDVLVGYVDPNEDPNAIPMPAISQASEDDDDDEEEKPEDPDADKVPHILMQLKKAQDVDGDHHIKFIDGQKHKLPIADINLFMDKYMDMKPLDREKMQEVAVMSKEKFDTILSFFQPKYGKPEKSIYEDEEMISESQFDEAAGEKDACYHKVKSRYKVWPSAYASGALVKCRKVGASNWGTGGKKKK